jgi:hypothetical protein
MLSKQVRQPATNLEPVRAKLEEDEEVMLLWSALVFRRRADVEGRDPLYLRPQGLAVPN